MNSQGTLSAEDIRKKFFKGKATDSAVNIPQIRQLGELTSSARFVVRQAKKRLGEQATIQDASKLAEEQLRELVLHIEDEEGEELTEHERVAAVSALCASLDHYDVLTPLIENPDANDIIVRAFNDVSIQIGRRNIQTDISFPDHETYKSFVENLLKRAGKSCTTATPVVDTAIDPHVRACVTHESFSPPGSGPMLTLRVARHRAISLDALVQFELAPRPILDYLSALIRHGNCTFLIGGEVGTGKTTLVKALATQIDENEAILIIEDTQEVVLERTFVRTLLTREANTEGAGRIAPAHAIRTGMRMAMNRIILGEMRDSEAAEAFIDVCASGHSGMSTIHARSAKDAISRLELFLSRAQGAVGIDTIRRQIANALNVVVYIGLDAENKKRRIFEVVEVGTSADGAVQISPMFRYAPKNSMPHWVREAGISFFDQELRKHDLRLPDAGSLISLDPEHMYRAFHGAN